MLHAILITHGSKESRLKKAEELTNLKLTPDPDILILEPDPSITIKQVRDIEIFLSKKSYGSGQKIILINQAGLLTPPAQHALLKTLEEPPANSKIILLAPNTNQLIDTILSRCQYIKLKTQNTLSLKEQKKQLELFNTIMNGNLSKRFSLVAEFSKSKITALEFCHLQLLFLKPNIKKHGKLIKENIKAIKQLQANVNPKLVLEVYVCNYPEKS